MKSGVHLAAALAMTATLAGTGAFAAPGTGTDLALRRVLLSSGGVGYFEYEATIQGDGDLHLDVRRDQVDDVLKSLVIADDAGKLGQISLAGKELASETFRDLPLPESALDSPAALLSALRGAEVRVESAGTVVVGRIVSVNDEQARKPTGETFTQHRLSLLENGALRQLVVESIESLTVVDSTLKDQLTAALDALSQQRERDRRDIVIHLSGDGERVVRVGYVAEAPLWKSTYRLVLPPMGSHENASLTSFAVVENRSGEPWDSVNLTLVSGNPVTFRQAIYDTYYVDRPTVPVEVVGRVLPQRDEGGIPSVDSLFGGAESATDMAAPSFAVDGRARHSFHSGGFGRPGHWKSVPPEPPPKLAEVAAAEATEQATQVVFHLPDPVTLASGQTALLPVLQLSLPAPRVSLYQPGTESRHPLSSIEIKNTSATDMPPGVLAVYERDEAGDLTYAGDAQLALLPSGASRFVSYAVDLRVTVDRDESSDQTLTRATIVDGVLTLTRSQQRKTVYTIAGAAHEPRKIILEHPRKPGFELLASDDFQVVELTATDYRLAREVPADTTVKVTVILERPLNQLVTLTSASSDQLVAYAATAGLPDEVRAALGKIVVRRTLVATRETVLNQKKAERTSILEDQARLRENLKAVPAGSDLAKKYLGLLADQEERLTALNGETAEAEAALVAARAALAAEIKAIHI